MMIKIVHMFFNSLVRNLTRAQRHSGRQIRHEAGVVDRVQRKVSSLTCHVSRVTCSVSGGPDLQPPGAAARPTAQVRLPQKRPARPQP